MKTEVMESNFARLPDGSFMFLEHNLNPKAEVTAKRLILWTNSQKINKSNIQLIIFIMSIIKIFL